jgi:hypothetical protein
MFRFSIRDVLWLTVVVAMGVCWYLERDGRNGQAQNAERLYRENEKLRLELRAAERANRVAEMEWRRQAHELPHFPSADSN